LFVSTNTTKINIEIDLLKQLFTEYSLLLELAKTKIPDKIETAALGTVLHSFYNGVENILKFIVHENNEKFGEGSNWHVELLEKVVISTDKRTAVISRELQSKLIEYMKFRHAFRHTYGFQLKWERMEPLVVNLNSVANEFIESINQFISK